MKKTYMQDFSKREGALYFIRYNTKKHYLMRYVCLVTYKVLFFYFRLMLIFFNKIFLSLLDNEGLTTFNHFLIFIKLFLHLLSLVFVIYGSSAKDGNRPGSKKCSIPSILLFKRLVRCGTFQNRTYGQEVAVCILLTPCVFMSGKCLYA